MIHNLYLPVIECHTALFLQMVLPHVAGVRHLRAGWGLGHDDIRQALGRTLSPGAARRPVRLLLEATNPAQAGKALSLIEQVACPVARTGPLHLRIALLCPPGPVVWQEPRGHAQFRRFAASDRSAAWRWLVARFGPPEHAATPTRKGVDVVPRS